MERTKKDKVYTILFVISVIAFTSSALLLAATFYVKNRQNKPFENPTTYPFVKGPTAPPPRL